MNSDQTTDRLAVGCGDLVMRLRSAVAMMAPHQKERHNGKLLIESLAMIESLADRVRICCEEWADDHTRLQDLCREAGCTDFEIEGDNYGAPGVVDLAISLRDRVSHNAKVMARGLAAQESSSKTSNPAVSG
jgi:hypothetical protein